ncbi:hypothetical protein Sthe_2917 [Sphaerobacter thermophilus DSM 20745]|uniref:Uncharacterized protein n=1 Tax=Sphaerobacter thermophilus (strain ATCC 49802 / DSM 20745 / KCCM 41009 / NCIMB 13125 / S 6022) TaxID=479434 RepID=D1C931_SPHTD|nr:hypothetical protein Sthe_2917 [Sphaerobacter thermophilus DSM 20745]
MPRIVYNPLDPAANRSLLPSRGSETGEVTALSHRLYRSVLAWLVVALTITACGGFGRLTSTSEDPTASPAVEVGDALSVEAAVAALETDRDRLANGLVDLVAYVNAAPGSAGVVAAQAGCPVAPEGLAVLTDRPFPREFSVAGVMLPNEVPAAIPALRLVVPYSLGIIDIPSRARLRGHFFDPDYAGCPGADRLFVLDELVEPVTGVRVMPVAELPETTDWPEWSDAGLGLGIRYPDGWTVEEARNQGAIVEVRFQPPSADATMRLAVTPGQTDAGIDGPLPDVLRGARHAPALLGPARARLVDVVGPARPEGNVREVRLVANYRGNTVVVAAHFTDGAALNPALLTVFSAMAASVRFAEPVDLADPLDPTLTARDELGPGPFIGEATAAERAVIVSGLHDAVVTNTTLVPEREARLAVPGSCREFPGQPEGVWLVTIEGTHPSGQAARLLVYLDAGSGERLCQTDAPASSND